MMKKIQVIDGADNAAYSIYAADERDFQLIFPGDGQDIEFAADFFDRAGKKVANVVLERLWAHPIDKKTANGIHGTLFYGLDFKKPFYPTKRETDLDDPDAATRRSAR